MRPGARVSAAIEILADLEVRRRPAADAVKDWMLTHRFAGSKDRGAIGDLVFGALRWKQSSAYRFDADTPRAWVWGAQRWGFGLSLIEIERACHDDPHGPEEPTPDERRALAIATLDGAPPHIAGDYPEWLDPSLARAFGDTRAEEGAALAAPAPLDLRANTLRTERARVLSAVKDNPLLKSEAGLTPFAPHGVRLAWSPGRVFPWASDQSFLKGWYEVQDEGSQIAALLSGAKAGEQVVDLCAGGGGKTLALAAMMENKGQVYAYDVDGRRLAPLRERMERAHARNIQIRAPVKTHDVMDDLRGRADLVLIDAPCTGSGTWRRNPDSKWRLRPSSLADRLKEQAEALTRGAELVKPGGRLVYVTCSVLPEENDDQIAAFVAAHTDFVQSPLPASEELRAASYARGAAIQMTPLRTGCDGFFVAQLVKR